MKLGDGDGYTMLHYYLGPFVCLLNCMIHFF